MPTSIQGWIGSGSTPPMGDPWEHEKIKKSVMSSLAPHDLSEP